MLHFQSLLKPYTLQVCERPGAHQTGQCVAVCCSVLQRAAVCCSVLQCAAVCCSVLQCAAVCCSVLQCAARQRGQQLHTLQFHSDTQQHHRESSCSIGANPRNYLCTPKSPIYTQKITTYAPNRFWHPNNITRSLAASLAQVQEIMYALRRSLHTLQIGFDTLTTLQGVLLQRWRQCKTYSCAPRNASWNIPFFSTKWR